MIEVEAKARISGAGQYRSKIKKMAKFVGKVKKIDEYYTLEKISSYPKKSIRIRKVGNDYEINFKQKLSYIKGVHAKNENEFNIKDITPFLKLIKDFGFKKWLKKEKESEIYCIKRDFCIEINYVKRLGWFLEVEYLSDIHNIGNARKNVINIMNKLGINEKDIIEEGYTKMLWDKEH